MKDISIVTTEIGSKGRVVLVLPDERSSNSRFYPPTTEDPYLFV